MIILPAIDLHEGKCVRLFKGDYDTAEVVAADAVETAQKFQAQGARWLHMVDLDGAKMKKPQNVSTIFKVRESTDMHIELGGGIRDMDTVDFYIKAGIDRVILGSAVLNDPEFVKAAIDKYDKKIAIGIDALDGMVATDGWLDRSEVYYLDLAKKIDEMGATYIIFTDIDKDGTLAGPNLSMLDKINNAVNCNIIASGGVSSIFDIISLHDLGVYGAIAGKSLYTGALDLQTAVTLSQTITKKKPKNQSEIYDNIERYFRKSELIPTIIQETGTNQVLMLAYMNAESLSKTMETGYTWFFSRSRNQLWNKGETSGNFQRVINIKSDCDDDTLLIEVEQKGPACHTGKHSCFYKDIIKEG